MRRAAGLQKETQDLGRRQKMVSQPLSFSATGTEHCRTGGLQGGNVSELLSAFARAYLDVGEEGLYGREAVWEEERRGEARRKSLSGQ